MERDEYFGLYDIVPRGGGIHVDPVRADKKNPRNRYEICDGV